MDPYDARCRDDQVQECRAAVAGDKLASIPSGGVCTPNEYDIYDQLCTLNYYTGGIDYCCCAFHSKALCCRFHYNHNYFRCDEDEDVISLPLSLAAIVAVSVVVVVVAIAVIVAVAVKCARGRRTTRDDAQRPETPPKSTANAEPGLPEPEQPLNPDGLAPSGGDPSADDECPASFGARRPSVEPSAPCADDVDADAVADAVLRPPRYERVESQPAELSPPPASLHGPGHELFRSESDNYEERRHLQTIPEPPPAYDEHREHRLYEPEVNSADRAANWL